MLKDGLCCDMNRCKAVYWFISQRWKVFGFLKCSYVTLRKCVKLKNAISTWLSLVRCWKYGMVLGFEMTGKELNCKQKKSVTDYYWRWQNLWGETINVLMMWIMQSFFRDLVLSILHSSILFVMQVSSVHVLWLQLFGYDACL